MGQGVILQFLLQFVHCRPEPLAFFQSGIKLRSADGRSHSLNGKHVLPNQLLQLIE